MFSNILLMVLTFASVLPPFVPWSSTLIGLAPTDGFQVVEAAATMTIEWIYRSKRDKFSELSDFAIALPEDFQAELDGEGNGDICRPEPQVNLICVANWPGLPPRGGLGNTR